MRLVMKEEYEKNDLLKKIQQNAFKKEIDNFKASQVELRKKIEEEEKVAERKIKEYQNEKITRENKKMEEQNRRNYVLNTVQQQLAEQIEKETRKKLELEKLQQDLHLAEQEAMDIYKEQNEMEKKINNKLYMQWSNECYQLEKAEKEKTEKELEQQFHDMMLNKFAKRDKLEAMNAQARKMKQIDHLKIIEKMIEEKKMKEKIEKEQTLADKAEEEQTEEIRQRMIEEEKLKILEKIQESFDSYQRIAISPEYKLKCLEQDSNR
ncbi:Meiosis-specific nuclear structural protein 1 [Nymphon striatum]|nr:Meiosis-specific nuclear structural protein 1 [Nymphon striatum]